MSSKSKSSVLQRFFRSILEEAKFLTFAVSGIFAAVIIFSLISLYHHSDDEGGALTRNSEIQFKIRNNEVRFRDELVASLNEMKKTRSFQFLDSISKEESTSNLLKTELLIDQIRNKQKQLTHEISIGEEFSEDQSSFFVHCHKLIVTYKVDFDELKKIVNSSDDKELSIETLRFGNFIKTSYTFKKKLMAFRATITSLIFLTVIVVLYFLGRIGIHSDTDSFENLSKKLDEDKETLADAKNEWKNDKDRSEFALYIWEKIESIESRWANYSFDDIFNSILYIEASKAEKKAQELYNKSNLMLIMGLLVAIGGVVIFYLSLPPFDTDNITKSYIALAIRPTLILIFIQGIAFYLLRQHRLLINDYKYFYEDRSKKSRYFSIHNLIQNENLNENELKLIEVLLNEKVEGNEDLSVSKDDVIDRNSILEGFKKMMEKI